MPDDFPADADAPAREAPEPGRSVRKSWPQQDAIRISWSEAREVVRYDYRAP